MISLKKVLITDLFGTLISLDSDDARKLYGGYEKEFAIVSRYMNEFLREDNYIAIVTELGGHGNFGRVFNNQIADLNSYIDDNLRFHLAYYLQGNGTILEEDQIRKEGIRSEAKLELLVQKDKRKQELYQLLNEGKLDLEELKKNYSKYIECKGYEIENENTDLEHSFYEDYPYSKEVIQLLRNIIPKY